MSNERGFTLIELLVVLVIVSIIAGVSASIFVSVIRSNNKSNIFNEIQQNGNFILQRLEASIRNAKMVNTGTGNSLSLELIDRENNVVSYRITDSGGIGVMQECPKQISSCGSADWQTISNSNSISGADVEFSATNIPAGSHFEVVSTSGQPTAVVIVLILRQGPSAPGRVDYKARTEFRTTVSLRNY